MKSKKLVRFISCIAVIAAVGSSLTSNVFAAEMPEQFSAEELAMANEVINQVTAQVTTSDGEVIELQPEFKLRRNTRAGRSTTGEEEYVLDFAQTYSRKFTSAEQTSRVMNAAVRGSMYYTRNGIGKGITVDRIIVDFEGDPEVQFSNRTVRCEASSGNPVILRIPMHYDSGNRDIITSAKANNRITVKVSAGIGYRNVRDTLEIKMNTPYI